MARTKIEEIGDGKHFPATNLGVPVSQSEAPHLCCSLPFIVKVMRIRRHGRRVVRLGRSQHLNPGTIFEPPQRAGGSKRLIAHHTIWTSLVFGAEVSAVRALCSLENPLPICRPQGMERESWNVRSSATPVRAYTSRPPVCWVKCSYLLSERWDLSLSL